MAVRRRKGEGGRWLGGGKDRSFAVKCGREEKEMVGEGIGLVRRR